MAIMPKTMLTVWLPDLQATAVADRHPSTVTPEKAFIPEGNLVELRFEDFESDAYAQTEMLYQKLSIPGWEEAQAAIKQYTDAKKGYQKNKYAYKPETVALVNRHWGDIVEHWNYEKL